MGQLTRALLGLNVGILEECQLVVEPDLSKACLEKLSGNGEATKGLRGGQELDRYNNSLSRIHFTYPNA